MIEKRYLKISLRLFKFEACNDFLLPDSFIRIYTDQFFKNCNQ